MSVSGDVDCHRVDVTKLIQECPRLINHNLQKCQIPFSDFGFDIIDVGPNYERRVHTKLVSSDRWHIFSTG